MNNQTSPFIRLSEDGRVDVLWLVFFLVGVGMTGSTYQNAPRSVAIAGWITAAGALSALGIIELGAAIAELRQHPESFDTGDRTAEIWMYLLNTRHGTVGVTGLALVATAILGEVLRVPNALQILALVIGGLLAGLGAYHPLLAPEEMAFFEEKTANDDGLA